jgi:hypothetical protein
MISSELHILLNPRLWKHKGKMPVARRFLNPAMKNKRRRALALKNKFNVGLVREDDLYFVWVGATLQDKNPKTGIPLHYSSLEKLLTYWEIAQ